MGLSVYNKWYSYRPNITKQCSETTEVFIAIILMTKLLLFDIPCWQVVLCYVSGCHYGWMDKREVQSVHGKVTANKIFRRHLYQFPVAEIRESASSSCVLLNQDDEHCFLPMSQQLFVICMTAIH